MTRRIERESQRLTRPAYFTWVFIRATGARGLFLDKALEWGNRKYVATIARLGLERAKRLACLCRLWMLLSAKSADILYKNGDMYQVNFSTERMESTPRFTVRRGIAFTKPLTPLMGVCILSQLNFPALPLRETIKQRNSQDYQNPS
jgi:hypothetical protein